MKGICFWITVLVTSIKTLKNFINVNPDEDPNIFKQVEQKEDLEVDDVKAATKHNQQLSDFYSIE